MNIYDELVARGLIAQVTDEQEIKELIRDLEKKSPYIAKNIFRSVENVNLNTVIAYKKDGVRYHFLDDYDTIIPSSK